MLILSKYINIDTVYKLNDKKQRIDKYYMTLLQEKINHKLLTELYKKIKLIKAFKK